MQHRPVPRHVGFSANPNLVLREISTSWRLVGSGVGEVSSGSGDREFVATSLTWAVMSRDPEALRWSRLAAGLQPSSAPCVTRPHVFAANEKTGRSPLDSKGVRAERECVPNLSNGGIGETEANQGSASFVSGNAISSTRLAGSWALAGDGGSRISYGRDGRYRDR